MVVRLTCGDSPLWVLPRTPGLKEPACCRLSLGTAVASGLAGLIASQDMVESLGILCDFLAFVVGKGALFNLDQQESRRRPSACLL